MESDGNAVPGLSAEFPEAVVRDDGKLSRWFHRTTGWMWLVALLCLILAVVLSFLQSGPRGPVVTVHFLDGHGLKAEDAVRYRGIQVGQVESVRLCDDLKSVDVALRLRPDAAAIACAGSQFWIERPQLSLSKLSGLETVVGAKYVGVIPGREGAPSASEFEGVETPPTVRAASDISVRIRFQEGFGIAVGSMVKYRGIIVGEVTDVRLAEDLSGVMVDARLMESARPLAARGTVFWVERPTANLQEGVRGLQTLVGGTYLAALPSAHKNNPDGTDSLVTEFVGADVAPPLVDEIPGSLQIVLDSTQRFGLERGAPVTFRGMIAGQITQVALTPSGHSVEVKATIFPAYRQLVRRNTIFWSRSGVDFHLGFRGLDVDVDPLTSLAKGGVAFATPSPAGETVPFGYRFSLSEEEVAGWQEWKPTLDVRTATGQEQPGTGSGAGTRPGWFDRLRETFSDSSEKAR